MMSEPEIKEIELAAQFAMKLWEFDDIGPMEDFMIEYVPVLLREIRSLKDLLARRNNA